MSQIDMLQNQVLEEIVRERANYYLSKNRKFDFWILLAPEFMNKKIMKEKISFTNFYKQHENEILDSSNSKFYSSLITSDKDFIKWIKLRLGYFEDINEIGKNKKTDSISYISDGLYGEIILNDRDSEKESPLDYNKNFLHPEIISNKFKKSIEVYYLTKK
jgi:hypothetical protein